MHKAKGEKFDIIVLGAGSGGLNVAGFMNRAGFSVLLIDKDDRSIGGDCLNYGCVPSKALIHAARIAAAAKDSGKFGLALEGRVDIEAVKKYIKEKQAVIRLRENAEYFRALGMRVELGETRFVSADSVAVNGRVFTAKKIVLATGSRPRELKVPGIERVRRIYTNETIFDIDFLPKNLLVVGGGPIGIELGQAFHALGSKVTVLDRGSQILQKEDPKIAKILEKRLQALGMKVIHHAEIAGFRDEQTALVKQPAGEREVAFDALLVSIGRVLNVENLDLHAAGIATDKRGLIVNDYLQTTNKNVFVVGDLAGNFQFTHAAELHAGTVIRNFFSPWKKKFDGRHMAWVTYTDPEIATFGEGPAELTKRGVSHEVIEKDFSHEDRAVIDGYEYGMIKVYIDKKGRLYGGTMIAPKAGEIMQEMVLAMSEKVPIDRLFGKVYPYPVAGRANRLASAEYMKRKLTPLNKKILKFLFR